MSPAWLFVLILVPVSMCRGAKVLGMFPFPARSHLIVQKALMYELARRGHEVTVVSPFPENKAIPNYTEIEVRITMNDLIGDIVPNYVQVGGMHVKPPEKLPQVRNVKRTLLICELQKYLDEAPHGVIYFSMGSNLQSSSMPESKRDAFLGAFSKLKQHVLWKWESDTLPGQPNNVKLGKWLPQSDILAHPNVRLFITHGGLLSTQEAIHRGVPLLGIPIFADQSLNMNRAVTAGYGLMVGLQNVTMESLLWGITEIIENPKYRERAQHFSRIYRDQPLTPLEQAAYWTEYVIRHKGAPHLRSAALDLAWYQYFLLDVIAVLALAVGSVVLIIFLTLRTILRKIRGGGRSEEDDKLLRNKKRS
ncbi:hypothetical protein Cfor_10048 [Coptotermes formosanus]|uniref:UDP-glucuronosyltransferase n=1 Tax=Coptotermes formosanus TaxID=36987 RepID=A0A6L2PHH3_COPFO|nr:hypothetical protein Cfor_10048 [Coptotermes formosanus]